MPPATTRPSAHASRDLSLWNDLRRFEKMSGPHASIEVSVRSADLPARSKRILIDYFTEANWHPRGVAFKCSRSTRAELVQFSRYAGRVLRGSKPEAAWRAVYGPSKRAA